MPKPGVFGKSSQALKRSHHKKPIIIKGAMMKEKKKKEGPKRGIQERDFKNSK